MSPLRLDISQANAAPKLITEHQMAKRTDQSSDTRYVSIYLDIRSCLEGAFVQGSFDMTTSSLKDAPHSGEA